MTRVIALCVFVGLILSACATLNENQCRAGDWFGIGVQDGANGRLTSHLSKHAKACADYGIAPNQSLWLQGRSQGLATYCTPANAYREGRSGRDLSPVCPPAQASELVTANLVGLRYHEITEDIRDAERDLSDIRNALDDLDPEDPAYATLLRQKHRTSLHIQRLKTRRLRYASYP